MTSGEVWAVIAFACLGGWAVTLFITTRAWVPNANAFGILEKLANRQDEQIRATLERIQSRRGIAPAPRQLPPQKAPHEQAMEQISRALGGAPLEPLEEQPDPDESVDIVEAN